MNSICIDTNAYTAFMRGEEGAVAVIEAADQIWIPFAVLGELHAGFLKGSRGAANEQLLAEVLGSPNVAVATATQVTSRLYAGVFDSLRRRGRPIPANDLWIAACAMEHGAPLLTFDAHFADVEGLELVSAGA